MAIPEGPGGAERADMARWELRSRGRTRLRPVSLANAQRPRKTGGATRRPLLNPARVLPRVGHEGGR
jgi:hypothetical protein